MIGKNNGQYEQRNLEPSEKLEASAISMMLRQAHHR